MTLAAWWYRGLQPLVGPVLRYRSRVRLPVNAGRLQLSGLESPVNILWDRRGIPTIEARSRHDLYFAQGFVAARDRLWQLELHRLAALGELASAVGRPGLAVDRLTRTLGIGRLAGPTLAQMGPNSRAWLTAYAAGINAYLAADRPLPVELSLLRHEPRPWRAEDSAAIGRLQAWTLSRGWSGEWIREKIRTRVGPAAWAELEPDLARDADRSQVNRTFLQEPLARSLLFGQTEDGGIGSNAWAIAPMHTAEGRPLLGSDIHLPLTHPGLFYLARHRVVGGEAAIDVAGGILPGTPFIVVGQNHRLAWALALSYADCGDLFIETEGPTGRNYFLGERSGEEYLADHWTEKISVRGASPETLDIRVSRHGPIVSDILFPEDERPLALCSTALDPTLIIDGLSLLGGCRDWEEFQSAAARIQAPSLSLVYADAVGNIGRLMTGRIPIRGRGKGLAPRPGNDPTYDWQGYYTPAELPVSFNPPEGFVIACNEAPPGHNGRWGASWMSPWRARRLTGLVEVAIARGRPVTRDDGRAWLVDDLSLPGLELKRWLNQVEPDGPIANRALTLLDNWDGRMSVREPAPAIAMTWVDELHRLLGAPIGQETQRAALVGHGPHPELRPVTDWAGHWPETLLALLGREESRWVAGRLGRRALLGVAFSRTVVRLAGMLGPAPERWQWGDLHRGAFRHAFSRHPLLGPIFDSATAGLPGSADTLAQAAGQAAPGANPHEVRGAAVVYRQLISVGPDGDAEFLAVPGQSGRLASPHREDHIPLWLTGEAIPMHPGRGEVVGRQTLTPSIA